MTSEISYRGMDSRYRQVVVIGNASEIRFDSEGMLEATYHLPHVNTTISNDHNFLNYMVKKGQLSGEFAARDIAVVNVDMHSDLVCPVEPPPEVDTRKTDKEKLDTLWEYAKFVGKSGYFVPLIYDGSIRRMVWLAENRSGLDRSLAHDAVRRFRCFKMGIPVNKKGSISFEEEHQDVEGVKSNMRGEARDFVLFTFGFDFFPIFIDHFLDVMPEEEARRRFLLSIDADRFVSQDIYDAKKFPDAKLTIDDVNERSLEAFRPVVCTIKKRISKPNTFIYSSTPDFAGTEAAREIIVRIVKMLEG